MSFKKTRCVIRSAVAAVAAASVGMASANSVFAEVNGQGKASVPHSATDKAEPSTKKHGANGRRTNEQGAARQTRATISAASIAGANHITIPTGVASSKYSVTRLTNPERLVIDLESTQLSPAQSIKPKGLAYVSGVRVGTHPGKTRVVVDLKGDAAVRHDAQLAGNALTLIVGPQQGAQESAKQPAKQPIADARLAPVTPAESIASVNRGVHSKATTAKGQAARVAEAKHTSFDKLQYSEKLIRSALTLDEEPVVSGSSKTAVAKVAAVEPASVKKDVTKDQFVKEPTTKQPVARQPIALTNSADAGAATGVGSTMQTATDRARLALPAAKSAEVVVEPKGAEAKGPALIASGPTQDSSAAKDTSVVKPGALSPDAAKAEVRNAHIETQGDRVSSSEDRLGQQASSSPAQQIHAEEHNVAASPSTDTKTPSTATAKISSIILEGGQNSSPVVLIKYDGVAEHSMTRTAPSEYVLTLRDTSASPMVLQKTLFASRESSGIRSVRAVADGSNTLVRIFTQPSGYLTAKRIGDLLRIEETQDLTQIARDIRAQIAPAAAKETEAGKDPSVGKEAKSGESKSKRASGGSDKQGAGPAQADQALDAPVDGELAAIKGSSATYTGRLISLDLQDADIDSALRIIAEVSNLNIVAGDGVVGKVTLKLVDVPWDQALEVILKSHGLDKVLEGNVLRVAPVDKLRTERESFKQARVAEEELEPLNVKYMRVSYAKAAEIKGLVETVLSERGTVAFDERSNQLVVKDTRKGLQNVSELIKKIDLRTPQILLETQIIEANRNLSRQLGAELGFQYIQSPATGNGTGLNFPAAIAVGGSADPTNTNSITGSAFPVASSAALGSAVTMLFDSADGTRSLALRLSQLEQEGQVRIISKPAVATTNNKAAEIKSVEKFRVKLPNGGLSIASGSGASSSGSGDVATQTIEAGIILNVTPQASPDYYILLDIKAKSSSFGAKSVDGIPNEIERSASSSVLVSSGQTFALGGIYKINEQDRISGVPFFKDIPVLGTLFRNTTTEQADEELLFFITPRIVEGSFEDASVKAVS
jgi:type IV pilus secretin PilQ/predicted competence protein